MIMDENLKRRKYSPKKCEELVMYAYNLCASKDLVAFVDVSI